MARPMSQGKLVSRLADFIRDQRTSRGWTQPHFDREVGGSTNYTAKVESFQVKMPTQLYLEAVAHLTNTTVDDLRQMAMLPGRVHGGIAADGKVSPTELKIRCGHSVWAAPLLLVKSVDVGRAGSITIKSSATVDPRVAKAEDADADDASSGRVTPLHARANQGEATDRSWSAQDLLRSLSARDGSDLAAVPINLVRDGPLYRETLDELALFVEASAPVALLVTPEFRATLDAHKLDDELRRVRIGRPAGKTWVDWRRCSEGVVTVATADLADLLMVALDEGFCIAAEPDTYADEHLSAARAAIHEELALDKTGATLEVVQSVGGRRQSVANRVQREVIWHDEFHVADLCDQTLDVLRGRAEASTGRRLGAIIAWEPHASWAWNNTAQANVQGGANADAANFTRLNLTRSPDFYDRPAELAFGIVGRRHFLDEKGDAVAPLFAELFARLHDECERLNAAVDRAMTAGTIDEVLIRVAELYQLQRYDENDPERSTLKPHALNQRRARRAVDALRGLKFSARLTNRGQDLIARCSDRR